MLTMHVLVRPLVLFAASAFNPFRYYLQGSMKFEKAYKL